MKNIRRKISQQRRGLSAKTLDSNARAIARYFVHHPLFQKSKIIASFEAVSGEQNPIFIHQYALQKGKKILLPIVQNFTNRLLFGDSEQSLRLNKYQIPEPKIPSKIPLWHADIVLVPLVAFDENGHRIGMGKGYYDATFEFTKRQNNRPILIGVAHAFQQVAMLTPSPWDVPLDGILTEQQLRFF